MGLDNKPRIILDRSTKAFQVRLFWCLNAKRPFSTDFESFLHIGIVG